MRGNGSTQQSTHQVKFLTLPLPRAERNRIILFAFAAAALVYPVAASSNGHDCLTEPPLAEVQKKICTLGAPLSSGCEKPSLRHRAFIGPEEIRTMDVRVLAELLVERLHKECDLPRSKIEDSSGIHDQSEIIIMVPIGSLAGIAKYGFLNQHHTKNTRGIKSQATRFDLEEEISLLRLPYSDRGRDLLPKYAAFNVKRGDFGQFAMPEEYGDVAMVLKPDVKKRTTWTYDDSLLTGSEGYRSNPKLYPPRTTRYKKTDSDNSQCAIYCEAQIWGDLNLQDVAYLMVKKDAALPPNLSKFGIPVYEYSPYSEEKQALQYTRGKLLQAATSPPTSPPKLSAEEIAGRLSSSWIPEVERNILTSRKHAQWTDQQLLMQLNFTMAMETTEDKSEFNETNYLVAELATRPKTQKVIEKLKRLLKSPNRFNQAQAAYGLSELPWSDFKPLLLQCLKSTSNYVRQKCVGLAGDHLEEPDVKNALNELANSKAYGSEIIKDWIAKLRANRLCDVYPGSPR